MPKESFTIINDTIAERIIGHPFAVVDESASDDAPTPTFKTEREAFAYIDERLADEEAAEIDAVMDRYDMRDVNDQEQWR